MKNFIVALIFLLTSAISFSQNWVTTGGNNQRNGLSEITGPTAVAFTAWSVNSSTSTAWGNTVYSYNDKFVTSRIILSPYTGKIELRNINTGAFIWEKQINASSRMYAVGFNEDAVYAHDYNTGILYALNVSDGSVKWQIASDMFPGNTGLLFACDGDPIDKGRRINKTTGVAKWTNNYIIPVGPDGGFCVYGNTYYHWTGSIVTPKQLIAIDVNTGVTKYLSAALPGDGDQENDLCIGPDGTIYICRDGGALYAFRDNGSGFVQLWSRSPGVVIKGIGKDGTLYGSNINDPSQMTNSTTVRLNPANGNFLDSTVTKTPLVYFACGADSTVYISTGESGNGRYVALTPNLQTIKWQLNVPNNIYSGPSLSREGFFIAIGAGTEIKGYFTNNNRKPAADFRASKVRPLAIVDSVNFFDQSSYAPTSWNWSFPGSNTPTSTQQNPVNIKYGSPGVYDVTLVTTNAFGTDTLMKQCYIDVIPFLSVEPGGNEIPKEYSLSQNYPNPFNPETKIKFAIPNSGFVKLVIYDIAGKEIETLINEELNPGNYSVNWNAMDYTSGVYFYKLTSAGFTDVKKMAVIK
jgi:PKD repeat protein